MLEIKQNKQMSKQGYDKKKYQFFCSTDFLNNKLKSFYSIIHIIFNFMALKGYSLSLN